MKGPGIERKKLSPERRRAIGEVLRAAGILSVALSFIISVAAENKWILIGIILGGVLYFAGNTMMDSNQSNSTS